MSRYRLFPTCAQEVGLLGHCAHARYVWNLAVEQHSYWRRGRTAAPGYVAQARQLTEARAASEWLRAGSQTVQQQALRDFKNALSSFYAGTHRRPTFRKRGVHESFRIVGPPARRVELLSNRWAQVLVPKVGWVRFRLTRPIPSAASYRVNQDRAGRWHIAFAAAPAPVPAPATGAVVGVDRGVAVSAALSTGELLRAPGLRPKEAERLLRLQRRLARAQRGSNRSQELKRRIARIKVREVDRRKDWVEKTSTRLAREFDVIRVEHLNIKAMTRSARGTLDQPGSNVAAKAGLNRSILINGWGLLVTRLEHKAPGRVEKIRAAYTSQTCSACGVVDREARESQAVFRCRSCGYAGHADVNAAINIAAGRAVTARGATRPLDAVKREPQPDRLLSA